MEALSVATDELLITANTWHALGAELATTSVPTATGLSCQASAAAVNAVHASAAAAGEAFAARTHFTALKTAATSLAFVSSQADAADIVDAITQAL
jgi:hypothetical protein